MTFSPGLFLAREPVPNQRGVTATSGVLSGGGASLKDGAKNAPTTLAEIVDAFAAISDICEQLWATGTAHP